MASVLQEGGMHSLPPSLPIRFLLTLQAELKSHPLQEALLGSERILSEFSVSYACASYPILPLGLSCLHPKCKLPVGKDADLCHQQGLVNAKNKYMLN